MTLNTHSAISPNSVSKLRPLKVMIVDDSAVVRGLVTRWIEQENDMILSGFATDGAKGIERIKEAQPDVLILDIEMPNMGGLEALPKLLAAKPGLKVLMASTLTTQGANITLRALELGAADFIPKPDSSRIGGAEGFRVELVTKIRALCGRTRMWPIPPHQGPQGEPQSTAKPQSPAHLSPLAQSAPLSSVRPKASGLGGFNPRRIEALFIGASTGGPPALRQFLLGLGPDWTLPIFIVQHMPASFTAILAEHLDKALSFKVAEAKDGDIAHPKHVYIAPGDFHMSVTKQGESVCLRLDQSPAVNWCRPAVDPLFASAAEVYGNRALGVVLTGMGHDGRDGAIKLVHTGAHIIAQDEASSVVWGMPGAVAEAGLCDIIRPLDGLAAASRAFAKGERP
jgi:two-component system, chemotaxis family, protein-glutamate methylesterase/glutaminase